MFRVTCIVALAALLAGAAMAKDVSPVEPSGGNPFTARNLMPTDDVCDVLGTIPIPGTQNNGMTFDGQYLWVVTNQFTPCVLYKIDPETGNLISQCTVPPPWSSYSLGLTYDSVNNTIWGIDFVNNLVTQVDMECNYISSFYTAGLGLYNIRGLAYDPAEDALVIGDTGGSSSAGKCVWVDRAGTPTGRQCNTSSVMQWHMGMEFGPSGYLWCNDDDINSDINQLDVSGPTAAEVTVCASPEPFNIPEGLTLDAEMYLRQNTHYGTLIYTIESGEIAGDTAYCQVTDVWTDSEYYLPGDEIILTVKWKYFFSGAGSPGWSVPEDFLVGGGLGKEPNGNPRFIQNTMVYDVEPGTYEEMFYFTVPMATPLGTGVGGGGHVWPYWSGPFQPEQHIYLEHNLCIIDVYTPPEFLIWERDPTPISGQPIGDALTAMGHTWEFVVNLSDWNLPDHMGLFVLLGIFSNNHVFMPGPDADAIVAYIQGGGKVYMEGGDMWAYDPPYMGAFDFGPYFGIQALGDGSGDLYTVNGVANGLMPGLGGLSSPYSGENNYIDELSPIPPAELVFQNPSNMDQIGIAKGDVGKTLGTSFELGGTNFVADVVAEFVAF